MTAVKQNQITSDQSNQITQWANQNFRTRGQKCNRCYCARLSITQWSRFSLPVNHFSGPLGETEIHFNRFKRSCPWVVIGRFQSILFVYFFARSVGCRHNYDWRQRKTQSKLKLSFELQSSRVIERRSKHGKTCPLRVTTGSLLHLIGWKKNNVCSDWLVYVAQHFLTNYSAQQIIPKTKLTKQTKPQ